MITHWNFLLGLGLLILAPALARPDPYQSELNPKAEIPGEVLYNELVDDLQKVQQDITYLRILGAAAIRQQREHVLPPLPGVPVSEEDDLLVESPDRQLNRINNTPKLVQNQKAKDDKKSNHYMSLCHFKLCNMGRKRNTRFLHFFK
ncbi:uncharacterized protein LOC128735643 [Sabethes cyaneus]|uniref:uncharacterized protein LOC128735643 n=1 Tax=Sabethes cyaneus TaxID=53552 RepID=UPI00221E2D5E|nr:uncharacterized protein LOC128735643 [Sabethes cyaneus]